MMRLIQEPPIVQNYFCFRERRRKTRAVRKFIRCTSRNRARNGRGARIDWDQLFAAAGIPRPC